MAEAVKVIVRCRPMNTREKDLKCTCVVTMDNARGQCSIQNPSEEKAPPKSFTFDGAYFTDSTTEQIYNDIAYPLVEGVTEGYNGTIFAYGQTGCGKSFSMQGITDPPTQRGIIPRAFDHIFETISVTEGCKFLVHASYLEIYNEEIRDLLGADSKKKLDLHEHPEKGVYVNGLTMHPVHNVQDCAKVMAQGWKNRSVGATLMNADSSRSHSIFTINLEMSEPDQSGEEHIRAGKLNLVDLAGSERQAKTGATGNRLKEATKINLSLSALGNVISALVDGKSKHIPYRDSKLTRLLQDSLGGNTKTLMVACLSPADNNYDETLSTLRYANRAKNIKNKPKINEDPKDALLRQYQEEIEKLKAMLMGQAPVPNGGVPTGLPETVAVPEKVVETRVETKIVEKVIDNSKDIEEEKQKLQADFDRQLEEMKQKYEQEKTDRAKLANDMNKLRDFYDRKLEKLETNNIPPSATAPVVQTSDTQTAQVDTPEPPKPSPRPSKIEAESPEPEPEVFIKQAPADNAEQSVCVKQNSSDSKQETVSENSATENNVSVVESELMSEQPGEAMDSLQPNVAEDGSLVLSNQVFEQPGSGGRPVEEPVNAEGQPLQLESAQSMHPESTNEVSAEGVYSPDELQNAQRAVHISSTREEGEIPAPTSSPTLESQQVLAQQEAMKRLQALQEQMVGGEAVNNTEVKERRKKRKKWAEEKKRKLAEAVQNMDDDGIMIGIYENVQDELKAMKKKFENEKLKTAGLEREIVDLQSEFEFDRIDYLDTIRKQDQQLKLQQAIIDKIHPCIRRDCNYSNLDKVRSECKWDDENQRWLLPNLVLEKTTLPSTGMMPGGRTDMRNKPRMNGDMRSVYDTPPEEDRFRQKLLHSAEQDVANNYFKPKRANQLLNQTQESRNMANQMMNGMKAGLTQNSNMPWHSEANGLRAASVHGQIGAEEYPMRKPTRLQSLPSAKGKKKKKQSPLDPL